MVAKVPDKQLQTLPRCAIDFIKLVIKKMRYRKKVRAEVMAELAAHFEDELRDCKSDEERSQKAQKLISDFGDAKLLGILLRRAKIRCRPLWQTIAARTFQIVGIIALYIAIRITYLSIGTANVNVNYIDWLNNLVKVNRPERENAKLYYDRAAELCSKCPSEIENKLSFCSSKGCGANNRWPADFNDFEMEQLAKWLTDNQPAFKALRQGSQKPYYWPIYKGEKSEITQKALADATRPISNYRTLVLAMRWQIAYETHKGNIGAALDNCMVLLKFGAHLQGKGLLIEQLVGTAIEARAHKRILAILETADVPVDILKSFDKELENHLARQGSVVNWEAEKAFWYDLIQRGFTDDGKGNGRVLKNGLQLVIKDAKSSLAGFFFWNYPDRRHVVAMIDGYFEQAGELLETTPWQLHMKGKSQLWSQIGKECFMLKILAPANSRIGEICWRFKTNRAALLTVLAVLSYQKEKGTFPANLYELAAKGYLRELPMDLYSDSPLVYKKTDNNFLLYSFGPNFKDNSGQISRDSEGRARIWADEGDAVFWPVPKPESPEEREKRLEKRGKRRTRRGRK
jgi:hypothetical protein